MPLNILSLDLDWFNAIDTSELPSYVRYFFEKLPTRCTLPASVAIMTEHQYLYPWCLRLMQLKHSRKVNVVNVDAHHDFYHLDEIKNFATHKVGCGNLFAFMAHDGILNRYTWVTNRSHLASTCVKRPELLSALNACSSPRVRRLRPRVTVRRMLDVWKVLEGETFDGFAIISSPGYTRSDLVQKCVRGSLQRASSLRGMVVRRNPCSAEFAYTARHDLDVTRLFGKA